VAVRPFSSTTTLGGYLVYLERKIDTGAWTAVTGTTKNTGTGGTVSVRQTIKAQHTYSYRWHFMGTETYQPRYSLVRNFAV